MNLDTLVDSIRNYDGVTRKNFIRAATRILDDTYNIAGRTALGFGDDASAIDIGNDNLLLMAADGMWGRLMEGWELKKGSRNLEYRWLEVISIQTHHTLLLMFLLLE